MMPTSNVVVENAVSMLGLSVYSCKGAWLVSSKRNEV
jgi:hypothetical protein